MRSRHLLVALALVGVSLLLTCAGAVCHEACSDNDFCTRHEGGAHCQHCWGSPKICREYPEPPPTPQPQPPNPGPGPGPGPSPTSSSTIFMYDYFEQRSISANEALIVPNVQFIWGGVNGSSTASIGHQLGGSTSAKISPSGFTYDIVLNLLQYNDFVHVDEVKNEPNCTCDDCASVVEQLCSASSSYCGRFLFFFRYPPGDGVGARVDLLEQARDGKVKRIMFETYPGGKNPLTWLDSDTIASRGDTDFAGWASLYQAYGDAVMPVVGIGNRPGYDGGMSNCALDMQYLDQMFALIHAHGPWWSGVTIYGASEVVNHCSEYTISTVIGKLHGYFSWWPHTAKNTFDRA